MGEKLGLSDAISLGVGAMIGGGIFSVLGIAIDIAQEGAPISFLIGGILSLLVGYCYIKFSTTYNVKGGSFSYIAHALNIRIGGFSGWLLSIGYIITLALYAYAFGAYGASMLDMGAVGRHFLQSFIIIVFLAINLISVKNVGKIESLTVLIKVSILALFLIIGLYAMGSLSEPAMRDVPTSGILMAATLVFVAFEGFQLIPQAIEELKNPKRTIRLSIYTSILIVMVIYALIAFVSFHNLSITEIHQSKEYVLAVAARPLLGQYGYLLISVAALLSTASAINATLFGTSRLTYIMATKHELPALFSLKNKNNNIPFGALIGISVLAILLVNALTLIDIAAMTSSIFLLIFLLMSIATFKKRRELTATPIIPILSAVGCALSLAFLFFYLIDTSILSFVKVSSIFVATFILEIVFKKTAIAREYLLRKTHDIEERAFAATKQEKDMSVREKMRRELQKTRDHLSDIRQYDDSDTNLVHKIIDIIDTLSHEVAFSFSGRKYQFTAPQRSSWLSKLEQHDTEIVRQLEALTEGARDAKQMIQSSKEDTGHDILVALYRRATEVRQLYRDRNEYLNDI